MFFVLGGVLHLSPSVWTGADGHFAG